MQTITVNNINVEVFKKNIKNIHLWVYPPHWRLRVATPSHTDDEVIRLLLIWKLTWIKKQIKKFLSQDRETPREFINWESHYFLWKRYLLRLNKANKWRVEIKSKKYIDLYVRDIESLPQKKNLMDKWYREELKKISDELVTKWKEKTWTPLNEFRIRNMKTRWGSCNIEAKRVWLNLELIKKDIKHIDYVILHEIIHIFERMHNDNFKAYMDKYMPNWREVREDMQKWVLSVSI